MFNLYGKKKNPYKEADNTLIKQRLRDISRKMLDGGASLTDWQFFVENVKHLQGIDFWDGDRYVIVRNNFKVEILKDDL